RGQFAAQQLLEAFDDFGMAFHGNSSGGAGQQCAATAAAMFQSESVAVAPASAVRPSNAAPPGRDHPEPCMRRWLLRASAALVLRSEEHTSELQSRENLVCRL